MDASHVWQAALDRIRVRISPGAFAAWFRDTLGVDLRDGLLTVGVSNAFASEHLRQRFQEIARIAASEVVGQSTQISFAVRPLLEGAGGASACPPAARPTRRGSSAVRATSAARTPPPAAHGLIGASGPLASQASRTRGATPRQATQPPLPQLGMVSGPTLPSAPPAVLERAAEPVAVPAPEALAEHSDLHPRYTFSTFVVGTSNRLAYAAAQEIAHAPGEQYNPLLLYGGVGLGKTHLLHAIGHFARGAGLAVAYVTAERFTNEIIEAIRLRTTDAFRRRYRAVDVLLVDDVQFIAGKDATEEEFFHTFNTLHESNKQIVLSSDCAPSAMHHLHDRLRSRFAWGLVADLHPPDFEHRLAILRAKVHARLMAVPEEVLVRLAEPPCESIRALEGALTRVVAQAQMLGQPLDAALVSRALEPITGEQAAMRPVSCDEVLMSVARHFAIGLEALRGKTRERQVAWARQVAMYLLREVTPASLLQIGAALGGRDHTTVMHGCARVSAAVRQDAQARAEVDAIRASLRG